MRSQYAKLCVVYQVTPTESALYQLLIFGRWNDLLDGLMAKIGMNYKEQRNMEVIYERIFAKNLNDN